MTGAATSIVTHAYKLVGLAHVQQASRASASSLKCKWCFICDLRPKAEYDMQNDEHLNQCVASVKFIDIEFFSFNIDDAKLVIFGLYATVFQVSPITIYSPLYGADMARLTQEVKSLLIQLTVWRDL